METIRDKIYGKPVDFVGVRCPINNVFYARVGDVYLYLKQPRPGDREKVDQASRASSGRTRSRYSSVGMRKSKGKHLTDLPLWRKGRLGVFNQVLELNGAIVGFARQFYSLSHSLSLKNYGFDQSNEVVCENFVTVLDEFQGLGLGSMYAPLSTFVARFMGADWIVGTTFMRGGMFNIRMREGWEVCRVHRGAPGGDQASIRYRIS